ncbi:LytTR family DNA-binding domain-containing protein [Phenylobacterium montanum]|uniref:LytTR family transcriptional regulator DNA-binding domain-containing protein n=1 Tax=Phenylobacterium montanum TaxID=2823693 RepID=A0A975IY17_9CAUL|nr:LytTR family DNA-binding domain-containing protein [Caulobacter sp. S6]QUD90001.1 LytTR family transcriptional regulator DNA-binding domain-containing protein [Caulobacter sp. S6]
MSDLPSLYGAPREWARDLAVAAGIGAFLGLIGPFGSYYGGPVELRVAYWVSELLIGFAVMSLVVRLCLRLAERMDLPVWFAVPVSAAIGALPTSLAVGAFGAWFWPGSHGHFGSLLAQYGDTLVIAEPCTFGYYFLMDRRRREQPASKAPGPQTAEPALAVAATPVEAGSGFLSRLPPRLGRDLICLQMEDHYVRAHTAKGSDLILVSLKDAVAELADADGLQVHRSWWVARKAVTAPVFNGRNLSLRLSNGLEAPVSRASVAKLRAAGWLGESEEA